MSIWGLGFGITAKSHLVTSSIPLPTKAPPRPPSREKGEEIDRRGGPYEVQEEKE